MSFRTAEAQTYLESFKFNLSCRRSWKGYKVSVLEQNGGKLDTRGVESGTMNVLQLQVKMFSWPVEVRPLDFRANANMGKRGLVWVALPDFCPEICTLGTGTRVLWSWLALTSGTYRTYEDKCSGTGDVHKDRRIHLDLIFSESLFGAGIESGAHNARVACGWFEPSRA